MIQTTFRPVANHAFIDLPSATMDGYQLPSGIYVTPKKGRIEETAAVIGTVVALPERLTLVLHEGHENEEKIALDVKEGDRVAVDYRVVSGGDWNGEVFEHSNCWLVDGKMMWKAKPETMLAVERTMGWDEHVGGGKHIIATKKYWKALGDVVLMKKLVTPGITSSLIIIPEHLQSKEEKNIATHVSGLDAPVGQKVMFNPTMASAYQFDNGEEYLVIRKDYVFGTINE